MQMTLPEIIMASTILTWIVLSTTYRIRSNQKIFKQLNEIKKLLEPKNPSDVKVTWRAGMDGKIHKDGKNE